MKILHQLVRLLDQLVVRLAQLLVQEFALRLVVLLQLVHSFFQVAMVLRAGLLLQLRLQIVGVDQAFDLSLHVVEFLRKLELSVIERFHLLPLLLVVAKESVVHLDLQLLLEVICGYKLLEAGLDPLVKVVVDHVPDHGRHVLLQGRDLRLGEALRLVELPRPAVQFIELDFVLLRDLGFQCLDLLLNGKQVNQLNKSKARVGTYIAEDILIAATDVVELVDEDLVGVVEPVWPVRLLDPRQDGVVVCSVLHF